MERRDLLRSAVLGTTMALLPPVLRRAFGASADVCNPDAAAPAYEALDRAQRRGKPLLVFVVPDDAGDRDRHGELFGELIDLGPERSLAMLALAEVACASRAAIRCLVPETSNVPGVAGAMMLVIDLAAPATVTPLPVALRVLPTPTPTKPYSPRTEAAYYRRVVRANVASLTVPLRRALAGTDLARRARINERSLHPDDRQRILTFASEPGATLPIGVADAGAPLLLASALATHRGDARRRAIARLAAVSRWRLQERPPPGARWSRLGGCGDYAVHGRDDEVADIGCGLASVPIQSARFLKFFTAREH